MLVAYAKLYSASNDNCNDLTLEYRAMSDLHVMPKLEVTSELKCLPHSITTKSRFRATTKSEFRPTSV
jgi:hypothetical protein